MKIKLSIFNDGDRQKPMPMSRRRSTSDDDDNDESQFLDLAIIIKRLNKRSARLSIREARVIEFTFLY